jgi:anti-sigma factor RsiW
MSERERNGAKIHPLRDLGVLMRFLDGESGRRERIRINAHLVSCAECAREVGAYRALGSSIAELPPRRAPAGLSSRLLMSVEAERRLRIRNRRHWVEWAGGAYAVSAVAILVTLGMSPWRENLLQAFRAFGSGLVSGGVGAVVGAFDRFVFLLDAAVRLGEAARELLVPLAPLWRSMQVLAAQPELRLGLALALVLSTALIWFLDQRRVRGSGRMNDAHAFI